MFCVAMIFAGTNDVSAQNDTELASGTTPTCITPTTLTCFGTATSLHPAVGVEYTYTITSTDYATSGTEKVHWFVIDNADMATAGGIIATAADMSHLATLIDPANGTESLLTADAAYNVEVTAATPNTSDEVKLSWSYFDGQSQVILLVAYVYDAANCTDNIEVFRIFPEFSFTLDVAAIDQDLSTTVAPGAATPADECVSPIESASYAPGAGTPADNGDGTLTIDYGQNYVYFMVNAANFVGAWDPLFDFAYDGTGTITEAAWIYPNAAESAGATWNAIDVSGGLTDVTSATKIIGGGGAVAADGSAANTAAALTPVGAAGECIIVRVLVDHGTGAENIVSRTVTMTVDGTMYDATDGDYENTALADYGEDTGSDGVCDQVANDDVITFVLTPRPDVNEDDPTPFEQKTGEGL